MFMHYVLALLPAIAALATASSAIYTWQRRDVAGAKAFFGFVSSIFIWCFFTLFEYLSTDQTTRIFFGKIQYFGIAGFAVFWLLFTLQYTHNDGDLTRRKIGILMVVPILSLGFALTDTWHGLVWQNAILTGNQFPKLLVEHGWWFSYVMIPYNYLLLLGGVVVLLSTFFANSRLYRQQTLILLTATLIPFFFSVLYIMADVALYGMDITPLGLALSSITMHIGLFPGKLFEVSPISYRTVFLNTTEAVIFLDNNHYIVDLNPSAIQESGQDKILGQRFVQVFPEYAHLLAPPILQESTTILALDRGEQTQHKEVKIRPLSGAKGRQVGSVVIIRDITLERKRQARLHHFAYFDSLTGLCNRRQLELTAQMALQSTTQGAWPLALLYVDLDKFKAINDTYGHAIGDAVLVHTAECIKACVRQGDLVARIGGDEFVTLLFRANREAAFSTRLRLLERLGIPLDIEGRSLELSASVGVACHPQDGDDLPSLLKQADVMMYQQKQIRQSLPQPD